MKSRISTTGMGTALIACGLFILIMSIRAQYSYLEAILIIGIGGVVVYSVPAYRYCRRSVLYYALHLLAFVVPLCLMAFAKAVWLGIGLGLMAMAAMSFAMLHVHEGREYRKRLQRAQASSPSQKKIRKGPFLVVSLMVLVPLAWLVCLVSSVIAERNGALENRYSAGFPLEQIMDFGSDMTTGSFACSVGLQISGLAIIITFFVLKRIRSRKFSEEELDQISEKAVHY